MEFVSRTFGSLRSMYEAIFCLDIILIDAFLESMMWKKKITQRHYLVFFVQIGTEMLTTCVDCCFLYQELKLVSTTEVRY